jgi:TonB-linked SusC/RagA family outer membrane protein
VAAALTAAMVLASASAAQQSTTIRGTVTDQATGRPITAASVRVTGTQIGAQTSEDGTFTLRGVAAGTAELQVNRIGYEVKRQSVTVQATGTTTVTIALSAVAQTLSQVVTIGYGTSTRATVSSAIASVDSTTFANIPVASIDNAMQGKVAGVQVMQNSGEPGTSISVRIRGPASLNAGNQPLYVIDGVPVIQDPMAQINVSSQGFSPMSSLNPDEIASIDVLKDAAAAAIYGSRGSNGVVMITTKRGLAGNTRWSISTYTGTQSVSKRVDMLDSHDYVAVMNEAQTNEKKAPLFAPGTDSISTNWQDYVFRNAPVSNTQIAMSGGIDKVKFYLSGTQYEQKGIVISSGYSRKAGRLNVDVNPNKRLFITSSLGVTRELDNRVPGDGSLDGVVTNALALQPMSPVYGQSSGFAGAKENLIYSNPVAIANFDVSQAQTLRMLANGEAKFAVTDAFWITGRGGVDMYNLDELRWLSPLIDKGGSSTLGGSGATGHTSANRYLAELFGNYDLLNSASTKWSVSAGSSLEKNQQDINYVAGNSFPTGFTVYVRNAAQVTSWDGSTTENNLTSFFGRTNLSYNDKYFLSGSLRRDGSSRFGSANRYGTFKAASLGWSVTNEGFASSLARFGTLKLRASYGTTGNQGIGDFASRTLASAAPYAGTAGLAGSTLGNPNLRWEQTQELDLGADINLVHDRVDFTVDWYNRNTHDLLIQRPVPATSGYTTVWDNLGSILNRGIDLGIHTVNLESFHGLGWTSDFNLTANRNVVTNLYDGLPVTFTVNNRITSVAAVGQPLGEFYLYQFLRVDPQTGNAVYRAANGSETLSPVSADLAYVGNPQPKFFGGLKNAFTFGAFDLRGFLQYNQGGKIMNMVRIFGDDGGSAKDNKFGVVRARWQKPGDITDVPRMGATSGSKFMSSRFVEDASFIRLNELTLGYKLPARLTEMAHMRDGRLYVSGRNLALWGPGANYSGYDPDVNTGARTNAVMGVDFYAYPLARTITFGFSTNW